MVEAPVRVAVAIVLGTAVFLILVVLILGAAV